MSTLHDAANELRRIEEMVAREFAKVDVPKAPDVRPAAPALCEPELGPIPPSRRPVETLCAIVAPLVPVAGVFLT